MRTEEHFFGRENATGCVPRSRLGSLVGPALLVLLVAAGCGGRTEAPSLTEQARLNADPRAGAFLLEAEQAYEAGYYNPALILTDSAAHYAPELADIPFLQGRILTAIRQYGEAQKSYKAALELDPAYPGAYLNLGNNAYLRGSPQEALGLYRQEKGAADSAPYFTQLGRVYAELGKADSAQWAYEQAIAADSTSPTPYMWYGQFFEDAGEFEQALQYSRRGLALRPDNLNYAYIVGVQLLRQGDLQGAVDMLTKVTEGMPWHYSAHYNLGQAYSGLGQSDDGAHYLARADTLLEQRKEVTYWENLLEANSHEPMLWVNYGDALRRSGRVDEAIEALTIAFSIQPQWLELQNNIANLLLMRGDTTAALGQYEVLLQIDSTQADIWLNLGTVHALTGRYDKARAAWETALHYDPEHPEARNYLAQLPR
jgi:tetratricopeptide (TPR) repeat protein